MTLFCNEVTPGVLAATAMMATAIGLAAALRHQASSEVLTNGNRGLKGNRPQNRKIDNGTGAARRAAQPRRPFRPKPEEEEEEEEEEDEWGRREIVKFIKEKTANGNGVEDIQDWEEINQVVREKIGNEYALQKWERFNEIVEAKFENGEEIDWDEMLRYASKARVMACTQQ